MPSLLEETRRGAEQISKLLNTMNLYHEAVREVAEMHNNLHDMIYALHLCVEALTTLLEGRRLISADARHAAARALGRGHESDPEDAICAEMRIAPHRLPLRAARADHLNGARRAEKAGQGLEH
jgi:hypothetical protein